MIRQRNCVSSHQQFIDIDIDSAFRQFQMRTYTDIVSFGFFIRHFYIINRRFSRRTRLGMGRTAIQTRKRCSKFRLQSKNECNSHWTIMNIKQNHLLSANYLFSTTTRKPSSFVSHIDSFEVEYPLQNLGDRFLFYPMNFKDISQLFIWDLNMPILGQTHIIYSHK